MPRLSDSMEDGTILKWLKANGDSVAAGDELVEIETDKATMTHESEADGVLEIVVREGQSVPVGTVIARVGSSSAADRCQRSRNAARAGHACREEACVRARHRPW